MDLFDFYFKQIVTQSQMDWAFDRVQTGMYGLSLDNEMLGIVSGLGVQQHAPIPDKSMDLIGPGVAYDPEGQRIYIPDALTVVDCSQDEFGTDTNPPTPTFQRYISIFARFKRNLTAPALDGNNIVVYTKQLESFEVFVRIGSEAAAGTAIPAPLMADAILLMDLLVTNGFTAILNGDRDVTRRQDWIRFAGTAIGTRVYGTPAEAVDDILALIDTFGGAFPFAFTSTWVAANPVLGTAPPPTTLQESLDAIVFDLADTGAFWGGARRIGISQYTAPNTFVAWAAASLNEAIVAIADALDGHIAGGAPAHAAGAIVFTPYSYLASVNVQTAIQELVDDLADDAWTAPNPDGAERVGFDSTVWNGYGWAIAPTVRSALNTIAGALVSQGAGTSGADMVGTEAIAGTPEAIAASDVMAVLEAIYGHLNARTERSTAETVDGRWQFDNGVAGLLAARARASEQVIHRNVPFFNAFDGGVNYPGVRSWNHYAMQDVWNGFTRAQSWAGTSNAIDLATHLVDVFTFVDVNGRRRVGALAATGGIAHWDPNDIVTLISTAYPAGSLPAGTWTATSCCCDGRYLYVMFVDLTAVGVEPHHLQCFDLHSPTLAPNAGWAATGTALPGTGVNPGVASKGDRVRIVSGDHESGPVRLCTANSWVAAAAAASSSISIIVATTGAIVASGSGDVTGSADHYASGGIASDGTNVFVTYLDSVSSAGYLASATIANPQVGSGLASFPIGEATFVAFPSDVVSDGAVLWCISGAGKVVTYELAAEFMRENTGPGTADLYRWMAFDGLHIWWAEHEDVDSVTTLYRAPCSRYRPTTAAQVAAVFVDERFCIMNRDEAGVGVPFSAMGRMVWDGDSMWALLSSEDDAVKGRVRRVPMAGLR